MTDKQTQLLEALAQKMGTTAQYLWAILVRGNLITGIYDLVLAAIGLVVIFLGYRMIRRYFTKEYADEAWIISGVGVSVAGLVLFAITGYYGIVLTTTPEYGAASEILGAIR
jgi:uncharacterized membrane protein